MQRVLIIIMCGAFLLPAPMSRAATRSTQDMGQSLESFQESVSRLEETNTQMVDYNRNLKAHIDQGKAALQSLGSAHQQMEKDAELYASKTEKKSGELGTFETQMNQIKDQLEGIDRDLEIKQRALDGQLHRQQIIWVQLAAANDNKKIEQLQDRNIEASAAIIKEKMELSDELQNAEKHAADLEKEVAYQSLLREDPKVSLPKLTAQRDDLRRRLAALSSTADQPSSVDVKEFQQLKSDVGQLEKERNQNANLLQMLQAQYDKSQKMPKNAAEEKKLQDTILALKKDNKLLKQQATELQFDMIDLDKRKASLEKVINSSR